MKFSVLAVTLFALGSLVSSATTSDPLPSTLDGLDIETVILFESTDEPIVAQNSTHLAVYIVKSPTNATVTKRDANADANADANVDAEAAPWKWYYPRIGDPAFRKRSADADAEANPWKWYYPRIGDPAFRK